MGYLDAFVPSGNRKARSVKTQWGGLDRKHTQDTGALTQATNIATTHLPFLRVAESNTTKIQLIGREIYGIYDVGDGEFVVAYLMSKDATEQGKAVLFLSYVRADGTQATTQGPIKSDFAYGEGISISVVPFNVYDGKEGNVAAATFERRYLLYPFCKSFVRPESGAPFFALKDFDTEGNAVPQFEHAAVHLGRVFGTVAGKIYASAWNNYADFSLPTADDVSEIREGGAWMSTTQSDVNASGEFTAIAVYDNHVVGFKRNFMHQIYNNKNPFRVADIARIGAISQEAVCECNRILFFVSEDGIYAYTGGYPECISDNLAIDSFEGAVLGADERVLYCYIPGQGDVLTYDTVSHAWGTNGNESLPIVSTAVCGGECLYAVNHRDGIVSEVRRFGGSPCGYFFLETDLSCGGELVEKRILKIRLQVARLSSLGNGADFVRLSLMQDGKSIYKLVETKENKVYVISMNVRNTCAFGHKVRVEGYGNFEIRYLQIDYEEGGERYV